MLRKFYLSQKNNIRGKGKHGRNGNYQKTRIQPPFVNMLPTILRVYADGLKNTSPLLDVKNKRERTILHVIRSETFKL